MAAWALVWRGELGQCCWISICAVSMRRGQYWALGSGRSWGHRDRLRILRPFGRTIQARLDGGCLAGISGDGHMSLRAVCGQRQINLCPPVGPWMRSIAMSGDRAMRSPCASASHCGWPQAVLGSAFQHVGIMADRKPAMPRVFSASRQRDGKSTPNFCIRHPLVLVWRPPVCSPEKIRVMMRRPPKMSALPSGLGPPFNYRGSDHSLTSWHSADLTEAA